MKVAIVTDWLVQSGGAEKVLAQMLDVYPDAEVFASVDYLTDKQREVILKGKKAKTTFIQKLPGSKHYRKYFMLMPIAMESLDLSEFDVILSCSSSVAKGVITSPDQLHVCYCNSPMRYAWDLQEKYLKDIGLDKGFKSFLVRSLLFYMRNWDVRNSNAVDYFVVNSKFIAKRVKKFYRRESDVIYPCVSVNDFECVTNKQDYYVTCSRMVPYKKIDLIVEAFSMMKDKKLVVIGDGPEMSKVLSKASNNITIMGRQNAAVLKNKMSNAKAFVFAAEEDFGIAPVEAQACGTPIIAYGKGGALETVIEGVTGMFFPEQTVYSIIDAVDRFETMQFDHKMIRKHSEQFSNERFKLQIKLFIADKLGQQ